MKPVYLYLYTGPSCMLCEKAARILDTLAAEGLIEWEKRDITTHPEWYARYAHTIPVVEFADGLRFEGRISEYRLRKALEHRTTRSQDL